MEKPYKLSLKSKVLLISVLVLVMVLYTLLDMNFFDYQAKLFDNNYLIFIPSLSSSVFLMLLGLPLFIGVILILVKITTPSEKRLKLWHGIVVTTVSMLLILTVLYSEFSSFTYVQPDGVYYHTLFNSKIYHWNDVSKVNGSVRYFAKSGWQYKYELIFKNNSSIDIAANFGDKPVFDDGQSYYDFKNLKQIDDSIRNEKVDFKFSVINNDFYKDAKDEMGWTTSEIREFKHTFHQE